MRRQILLLAIGFVLLLFSFLNPLFSTIYSTVSGRVIDKDTGKGVPDVVIDITEKTSLKRYTTKTDSEGRFFFKEVIPGVYEIADYEIYFSTPSYYIISFLPSPFEVKKGMNVKNLNIYLQRGGVIEGRVFKEDGVTPVERGTVSCFPSVREENQNPFLAGAPRIKQGRFRCEGLLPSDKGFAIVDAGGYRTEYVTNLKIEPGKTTEVTVIVGARSKTIVKGKITDEKGTPLYQISVFIYLPVEEQIKFGPDLGWSSTDAQGEFIIKGLDGGKYYNIEIFSIAGYVESLKERIYIKVDTVNEFNFVLKRRE